MGNHYFITKPVIMSEVTFNLKNPSAEKSLVIMRYRLPKGRLVCSTKVTVPTRYWNANKQSIRDTSEYPQGRHQQFMLDRIEAAGKKSSTHSLLKKKFHRYLLSEKL